MFYCLLPEYYQHNYRVGKQRLREARGQAADYLILLLAGACLGTLAKANDEEFGALGYTYTIIAVCKLPKIGPMAIWLFSLLYGILGIGLHIRH